MRRRILTAILGVTGLAIVLFGVPLTIVVQRFVDQEATMRLERQAILAAKEVPTDFAADNDPVELPAATGGASLALYGLDGRLVVGQGPSTADAVTTNALHNAIDDLEAAGRRVLAVPVTADERVIGAIRAEQTTAASSARAWRITGLLVGLAVVVFGIGSVVAAVLARRLARPVRALSSAAVAVGHGDFSPEIPASGIAEIDEAASSLQRTAGRLDDLIRRERSFSADASHQLRTPLAGMRAAIETEIAFPRDDRTTVLHEVLDDIERLEDTVADLLRHSRDQSPSDAVVDLDAVLTDARAAWNGRLAIDDRPLRFDVDPHTPSVRGNRTAIGSALDVLLDNALVHGRGTVTVRSSTTDRTVTVSVSDEGPGFGDGPDAPDPLHGRGLDLADRMLTSIDGCVVITDPGPRPTVAVVLQRTLAEPGANRATPSPTS